MDRWRGFNGRVNGKGTYLRGVDAVFRATGGSGSEGAVVGVREEVDTPAGLGQ